MIKKITAIMSFFVMSGCGLGHSLQNANIENERYKTCILHQIETYTARYGERDQTAEKATAFVVSSCKQQEEAYVVAMTDLAMTLTGDMVAREKFLEDEEASLRGDLHELAASYVEQEL